MKTYKVHPANEAWNKITVQAESEMEAACLFLTERPTRDDVVVIDENKNQSRISNDAATQLLPELKTRIDALPGKKVAAADPRPATEAKSDGYGEIGGWLWLFAINLGVMLVMGAYDVVKFLKILHFDKLPIVESRYPGFTICMRFWVVLTSLVSLLCAITLSFFFMRKWFVRPLVLLLLAINAVGGIVGLIWMNSVLPTNNAEMTFATIRQVLFCVVWGWYFISSRRVLFTFVE